MQNFQDGKSNIKDSVKELLTKAELFLMDGDMGSVVDCLVLAVSIIEDDDLGVN